jgi:hypothetical protein
MTDGNALGSAAISAICRHHWVIDTPNGAVSGGRCKRCGIDREFRNSTEDLMWDSDSFSLNGSRYRGRRSGSAATNQLS